MDTLCNDITLTWYPGSVGTTDDPLVLLAGSNAVPLPSGLSGLASQLVDVTPGHRWATPGIYARGNVSTALRWVEVREIADRMEAQEVAIALAAGLPSGINGWLLIELTGRDTTWSISPAVVRQIEWTHDDRAGQLSLTWGVDGGALAVYDGETPPPIYPYGEIILGPGTTNRGALLLGPNRTIAAP